MVVEPDLQSMSYFVLAGTGEEVSVVDMTDVADHEWILYLLPGNYDTDLCSDRDDATSINSSLLTYLINRNEIIFDFSGRSERGAFFSMKESVRYRDVHHVYVERAIQNSPSPDFIEVDYGSNNALLSPFMGVGTRIPVRHGVQAIAGILSICAHPCNTHGVLVGDCVGARSLLGDGLQAVRGILFGYLGIVPSERSVAPDIPIPIIYSEYTSTPLSVDIAQAQTLSDLGSKADYMLASVVKLASYMYALLAIDHGYLGLDVLSIKCPRDWAISTNSSITRVPYRYPALVGLLAAASRKTEGSDIPEPADLYQLFSEWGSDSLVSGVLKLRESSSDKLTLFEAMPKLTKSFFVQLYRISCKDISLPGKTEYPRRTEASRHFVTTFKEYRNKSTLSGYLELADLLVQASMLQTTPYLSRIARLTSHSVYDVVLNPSLIPAIPVKGSVTKEGYPLLWPWSHYKMRREKYTGVEVVVAGSDGSAISLMKLMEDSALDLLGMLEDLCNSERVYTLVNIKSLEDMTGHYGFSGADISESMIRDSLLPKVTFSQDPITRINLRDVVEYHEDMGHPATGKLIRLVIKLLTIHGIESVVAEGSRYIDRPSHKRLAARLAVKQRLGRALDSRGV